MAAAKEITLKVNIDPSGAVSGAKAVAGGAAEATVAINKINESLKLLNSAYESGRQAVNKYNTEMAVLDALERHNLDTKHKLGQELAESVRQNIQLIASVKASEQALKAQEAAERSAISAKVAKRKAQDDSAVALYQEVQALKGLHAAYQNGQAAVDAYNRKMFIKNALLEAGRTMQSAEGQAVASDAAKHWDLTAAIAAAEKGYRSKAAAIERAHGQALADAAAMERSKQAADAIAVSLHNDVIKLEGLRVAYAGGRAAIEEFNRAKYIEQTVASAVIGKTQAEIQAIASDAQKHWELTAAVKALEGGLRAKEAAMEAAHAEALADAAAMERAKKSTDAFIASIQNEVARLNGLKNAYVGGRTAIAAFNLAHEIQVRQMRAGVAATSAAGKAIDAFTREEYEAKAIVDQLEASLRAQEKAMRGVKPASDHATHGISTFQTAVMSLATIALNKLRNEIVSSRQSFDRMVNTFAVASSSSSEAAGKLAFLRENASKLGLDIQSVGVSFAKFDVAAQNTSLSSKQIRDIFVSVSEATTAMGLSSEVAEGAILSLQQMISKGTVQSEELRGQFAERIPGAFRLAAEAMGWTQLELAKNLEQGRVLSEDLLPKLAKKLHEVFGPGSVAGSRLLSAEINRLKNEWFDFLVEVSKDIRLPELIRLVSENFRGLVAAVEAFIAVGLLLYIPALVEKFKLLKVSVLEAGAALSKMFTIVESGQVVVSSGFLAVILAVVIAAREANVAFKEWSRDSSLAMTAMVAEGERLRAKIADLKSVFEELNKLRIDPNATLNPKLLKSGIEAISDEIEGYENTIQANKAKIEKYQKDIDRLSQTRQKFGAGSTKFGSSLEIIDADAVSKAKKEIDNLTAHNAQLAHSLEPLRDRLLEAKVALKDIPKPGSDAIQAWKTYSQAWDDALSNFEVRKRIIEQSGLSESDSAKAIADAANEMNRAQDTAEKTLQNALHPKLAQQQKAALREATVEANKYAAAIDHMVKKYAEQRAAVDAGIAASKLAEKAYRDEKFGAVGSADALERLAEVKRGIAEVVNEKLHPGYNALNDDISKLGVEVKNSIADNEAMAAAYTKGAEAVADATKSAAVNARMKEILTKAELLNVDAVNERVIALRKEVEAEYDTVRATEIHGRIYEEIENSIKPAIAAMHEYGDAILRGPDELEEYQIKQEALSIALSSGAKTTTELKDAMALLMPWLRMLKEETKEASGNKLIDDLKYETEWMNKYADALAKGVGALEAFNIKKQVADALRNKTITEDQVIEYEIALQSASLAKIKVQFAEITNEFQESLWNAFDSSLSSFFKDFAEGNKDAVKNLGDSLVDALLDAAAKWLAQMLVNIAKAAAASGSIGGATSSGGGGFMGALGSMFGGSGAGAGVSSGTMALGAWAAVAAAAVAIVKHQADSRDSRRYNTNVNFNTHDSGITTDYVGGKLTETGQKISDEFRSLMEEIQSATGALLEGAHSAAISVRNDKEGFKALVDGVLIGTFKTAEEAIVQAMKKLFASDNLQREIDPIVQQVINNFDATKGAQAFSEAVSAVSEIVDELSGLTDVEIALRDLPTQTSQLATKLHEMGVAIGDAQSVADKWAIGQRESLRDQITGHQATQEELRAEQERKAAMFNAELAIAKASMALRRDELEAKIANFGAEVKITNYKYEIDLWKLKADRDIAQQSADIAQYDIDVKTAAANASLAMLQAQLAVINQAMDALEAIAPISMDEIRLPNSGGSRPSGGNGAKIDERLQRAEAFADFLENLRLDGLSDYQRALAELDAAFAEHVQAASEMEGGEQLLAAARREALEALREDLIDAFGSPMEGLRDRIAEIRQRVADWYAANDQLIEQFQNGEISLQQLLDSLAEANSLWAEFSDMAKNELLEMALYFTDALGDTEESARIRAELAEMEWDFKRLEMRMLIETYEEIGWLSASAADHWRDFIDTLPENLPAGAAGGSSGSDSNILQQAINRLRNAIDNLRKSNENLLLSDVTPLSTADQFAEAQARYNETLALAQSGDLTAIEDFASVRDQYLALAAAMYGTSGAGYQSIFQQSLQAGQDLATAGQAILDAIPPQMAGVEERLDTIAEILAAIAAAQSPITPPPPQHPGGDGGPLPPPSPRPPHQGDPDDPNYDPNQPPRPPFPHPAQNEFGGNGDAIRSMNANLLLLLQATEMQARESRNDRMMRIPSSGGGSRIAVRRGS